MTSSSGEKVKKTEPGRQINILPADRLNAFADGVFAIAITLLVLELPVPGETEELFRALVEEWPDFLAYVISFVFIGGFWVTHASITQLTKQEDEVTFRLTLITLFFVSIVPFTTSLMASHISGGGSQISVLIYGLDLFVASLMLNAIMRYLARRPRLLVDDIAEEDFHILERRRRYGIFFNGIGVLLALFLPQVAVAIYILVAIFFFVHPLFYRRILERS